MNASFVVALMIGQLFELQLTFKSKSFGYLKIISVSRDRVSHRYSRALS